MTIEEILESNMSATEKMAALKAKSINVPAWPGMTGLQSEYDVMMHPVNNRALYPDLTIPDGDTKRIERVTRVGLNWQQLASRRMTELITGIPIKRIYHPEDDKQKEVAAYMEKIYKCNRIDSLNISRFEHLFSACEVMTLWYAVEGRNKLYGFDSPTKLRSRNFSPRFGDSLYPLWDEDGDMIALSVAYKRKVGKRTVSFFDAYTATRHIKFSTENGAWDTVEDEDIVLEKIPAIYVWRPTPIWERTSNVVYETEWALSRNGNYLRENSKPLFVVFADQQIQYGDEGSPNDGKAVLQYPQGSTAQYVTWSQATDSLKYHIGELRNLFFTSLQLPDFSYEKMSQVAMSGESRKQLFIDAELKVNDEKGRLLEFLDREVNVVKAFMKTMLGSGYAKAIDGLLVENEITCYNINDEKDTIANLSAANGGKPLMSQRESITALGWSADVDATMEAIKQESVEDVFNGYE